MAGAGRALTAGPAPPRNGVSHPGSALGAGPLTCVRARAVRSAHAGGQARAQPRVRHGVDQRQPGRLDDVAVHADRRPRARAVGRLDEHPGDGVRPARLPDALRREQADLEVRQLDVREPGLWGDDDASAGWVLSSETTGLDIVGAEYVRDVEPGEIVVLEAGRPPRSVRYADAKPALCVFELIYFARPDSYMEGRNLYEARRKMGMQLADEHPIATDLVMPVPDTGAPAAAGYAERSGIPFREGLVRNRYTGRTFIQPSQTLRHRGVTLKLNPLREVVRGQRLTVVDDSIVRGTTTKQIVALLRKAGAAEVHVRISAPPIYHPCFYGIDTQIETELIASTHSVEEIQAFIGADSLGYLSIAGVLAALELPYDRFCFACFDGNYPEPVPYDARSRKFMLEEADPGVDLPLVLPGAAGPAGRG